MIDFKEMPKHIAIIMDGNGRWANERGLARSDGHIAGAKAAKEIVSECRKLGLSYLTLYTFSSENWGRPKDEIGLLFKLLVDFLTVELPEMEKHSIRLNVYGDISALPFAARKAIEHAMNRTKNCCEMTVNLALNYSGRDEILNAVKSLLAKGILPKDLTEEIFRKELYSKNQPDPDLIIRTSGELRLSNFLTFQNAYSELYFTDSFWPDFTKIDLHNAILDFNGRSRRFGLTQEQINK